MMTLVFKKIYQTLVILAISLTLLGLPHLTYAGSQLDAVLDTEGNPLQIDHNYRIKVQVSGVTQNYYWYMQMNPDLYHWVNISSNPNMIEYYQFTNATQAENDGIIHLSTPYKMVLGGDGQYLYYQAPTIFYPHGGLYLGQRFGSINFTLKLAPNVPNNFTYTLTADDGPIFMNPAGKDSHCGVVTQNIGTQYTAQFIKP